MERLGCLKLIGAVFGSGSIESVVEGWLNELTPRERAVIELRFGLKDNSDAQTLEEVGKEFSVTRERIRQVEAKALRHIRLVMGFNNHFYKLFT